MKTGPKQQLLGIKEVFQGLIYFWESADREMVVFWFGFEVSPLFGCKESKRGPLKRVLQSIAIS